MNLFMTVKVQKVSFSIFFKISRKNLQDNVLYISPWGIYTPRFKLVDLSPLLVFSYYVLFLFLPREENSHLTAHKPAESVYYII